MSTEIEKRFTYHPPKPEQIEHYAALREMAKELARELLRRVPAGREQALALTHLEEVVMWANAGIARN